MKWSWSGPARGDVLAIVMLVAIVVGFAIAAIGYRGWGRATGFGPDWDCHDVGKGDPVCVKKPAVNSGGSTAPAR